MDNNFFDEKILDMMNQAKETALDVPTQKDSEKKTETEAEPTLENGRSVKGKKILFDRRIFAKNTISMMVPTDFSPMSEEVAKIKYPSEHRPELILTNDLYSINLMFNFMNDDVSDDNIEEFRDKVFTIMKRMNGGIKEKEHGSILLNDILRIGFVEFTNPVIDGKLFNLMFFIPVDGKPLMGSFNCLTKDAKYWTEVFYEMINSIEIIKEA